MNTLGMPEVIEDSFIDQSFLVSSNHPPRTGAVCYLELGFYTARLMCTSKRAHPADPGFCTTAAVVTCTFVTMVSVKRHLGADR